MREHGALSMQSGIQWIRRGWETVHVDFRAEVATIPSLCFPPTCFHPPWMGSVVGSKGAAYAPSVCPTVKIDWRMPSTPSQLWGKPGWWE